MTYAYSKGHNDGLQGRERKEAFNIKEFQDQYNKGYTRGLIDSDIFDCYAENNTIEG